MQQFSPAVGNGRRAAMNIPRGRGSSSASAATSTELHEARELQLFPRLKCGCGPISGETCRRLFLLPWRRQPHSLPVPPHSFPVPTFMSWELRLPASLPVSSPVGRAPESKASLSRVPIPAACLFQVRDAGSPPPLPPCLTVSSPIDRALEPSLSPVPRPGVT